MSKRTKYSCGKGPLSPKAKFYKGIRFYVIALLVLFSAGTLLDSNFFDVFRALAFWGGMILFFKFLKVRGLPGTNGWLSDDWFDWITRRHPVNEGQERDAGTPGQEGEAYDPLWKDKDLI